MDQQLIDAALRCVLPISSSVCACAMSNSAVAVRRKRAKVRAAAELLSQLVRQAANVGS